MVTEGPHSTHHYLSLHLPADKTLLVVDQAGDNGLNDGGEDPDKNVLAKYLVRNGIVWCFYFCNLRSKEVRKFNGVKFEEYRSWWTIKAFWGQELELEIEEC